MKRLWALAPLAVLLIGVVLFAGFSLRRNPRVTPMAMVGKPLPDLKLAAAGQPGPVSLRRAVKGPALVNFFASWCAPCAQESPALMALKAEGVPIVGVAYKDDPAASARFLARLGDPYAQTLEDSTGSAGIEFGLTGVPETYAVDASGIIKAKVARPLTEADAESLLAAAGR